MKDTPPPPPVGADKQFQTKQVPEVALKPWSDHDSAGHLFISNFTPTVLWTLDDSGNNTIIGGLNSATVQVSSSAYNAIYGEGDWKPVWFQNSTSNDPKTWCDLMARDNVQLYHRRQLKQSSTKRSASFAAQMKQEAARLAQLPKDFTTLPIFRPACDSPWPCVWQHECYLPE